MAGLALIAAGLVVVLVVDSEPVPRSQTRTLRIPPESGLPSIEAAGQPDGGQAGPSSAASGGGPGPSAGTSPSGRGQSGASPTQGHASRVTVSTGGVLAPVAATTTAVAVSPIVAYTACTTADSAVFTVTFSVAFRWSHVFVDSDRRTATGYRDSAVSGGLGADFMVENDTLYRSTGSAWGWSEVGGVNPVVSHSGGQWHWRVPLDAIGPPTLPLLVVFNGSGSSPDAYTPVIAAGIC